MSKNSINIRSIHIAHRIENQTTQLLLGGSSRIKLVAQKLTMDRLAHEYKFKTACNIAVWQKNGSTYFWTAHESIQCFGMIIGCLSNKLRVKNVLKT